MTLIPHIIHYTDNLPSHAGGVAKWFVIRIRPKYKDDKGIHAHELLHVAKWWVATLVSAALIAGVCWHFSLPYVYTLLSLAVFDLLYTFVHPFAIWCEVIDAVATLWRRWPVARHWTSIPCNLFLRK